MHADWLALLKDEFDTQRMRELSEFLRTRRAAGVRIYPPPNEIFAAFEATPPATVQVVVLGQDPYHNPGQAHGLCFSVNRGVAVPPSLANIYRELHSDLGFCPPDHGDLRHWAQQGVLLINSVLTVEHNQPASHQGRGWEQFTDAVINAVNAGPEPVVFMLWGSHAQKKGRTIDEARHLVLRAPHPSPLSAHRGFFGCRHFSAANEYLTKHGRNPIDWQL
ncbi:MAG: uracil-DNA glycosylase [Pseudomonadota bacterium]